MLYDSLYILLGMKILKKKSVEETEWFIQQCLNMVRGHTQNISQCMSARELL